MNISSEGVLPRDGSQSFLSAAAADLDSTELYYENLSSGNKIFRGT